MSIARLAKFALLRKNATPVMAVAFQMMSSPRVRFVRWARRTLDRREVTALHASAKLAGTSSCQMANVARQRGVMRVRSPSRSSATTQTTPRALLSHHRRGATDVTTVLNVECQTPQPELPQDMSESSVRQQQQVVVRVFCRPARRCRARQSHCSNALSRRAVMASL